MESSILVSVPIKGVFWHNKEKRPCLMAGTVFILLVTRIANTDTCELGNQLLTCTYPGLIRSNYESPFICLFKDNLFCQKLYYDA